MNGLATAGLAMAGLTAQQAGLFSLRVKQGIGRARARHKISETIGTDIPARWRMSGNCEMPLR